MRSISSIGIEIISSLASFSTTSLCRQVTITPYSLLEPTIRPFSDTFHCLIFVFFVYLALILGRGGKSVCKCKRWVLYLRRVLYLRVVALQMAYCTYLFEDTVAKIRKFEYFRPRPFDIKTPTLVRLIMAG